MRRPPLLLALAVALPLLAFGCGGGETKSTAPETVQGTIQQQTVGEGDPAAGKEVFNAANPTCGSCHTFTPAGASGMVGPNLDEVLKGKDAQFILTSIVNPDAEIAQGFQPGIMPKDYGTKLSQKQLADLVAFLQTG